MSAQSVLYQATVMAQGAEVHCKPGTGKEIYVTNHLRHADVVQVVGDHDDGWLEIVPPAGSFSWINARDIQHPLDWIKYPNNYLVSREGSVPVFIGSSVDAGSRHTVVGVQLPKGSQVARVALDTVKDHDGDWVRIQPPGNEVRYIRAEMVKKFNHASGGPERRSGIHRRCRRDQRLPAAGAESLSCQLCPAAASERRGGAVAAAQQAERAGNVSDAIQLYSELASQTTGNNHELAMQALNRAYWLANGHDSAGLDRAAGAGAIRARDAGQRSSLWQRRRGRANVHPGFSARAAGNAGRLGAGHAGGLPFQWSRDSAALRTSPREPQNLCAHVQPELSEALRHSPARPRPRSVPRSHRRALRARHLPWRSAPQLHDSGARAGFAVECQYALRNYPLRFLLTTALSSLLLLAVGGGVAVLFYRLQTKTARMWARTRTAGKRPSISRCCSTNSSIASAGAQRCGAAAPTYRGAAHKIHGLADKPQETELAKKLADSFAEYANKWNRPTMDRESGPALAQFLETDTVPACQNLIQFNEREIEESTRSTSGL